MSWQQPDWNKLFIIGGCKFPRVAWTDEEQKMILDKDGVLIKEKVEELRTAYLRANEKQFTSPESSSDPLKVKQAEYEKLYNKKAVGKRSKDEEWLDVKIALKKQENEWKKEAVEQKEGKVKEPKKVSKE